MLDDDEPSRVVTRIVLIDLGHECVAADSVAVALATIESFQPDAIVYEWRLKRRDNYGLAATLRTTAARYVHAPAVIALSALDEPDDFRSREAVDAYVTKPFDVQVLASTLVRANSTVERRVAL